MAVKSKAQRRKFAQLPERVKRRKRKKARKKK